MNWNTHYDTNGFHAFLSPSRPSWINYDNARLEEVYRNYSKAALGTRIHELAKELIEMRIRLPQTNASLNMFVNDAIGFAMRPEQVLFYSQNAFGTADAICYSDNVLRIHDLKTGITPGKLPQVEIYSALFCLEYGVDPNRTEFDLRIYQSDEVVEWFPTPQVISNIMSVIVRHDEFINIIKDR